MTRRIFHSMVGVRAFIVLSALILTPLPGVCEPPPVAASTESIRRSVATVSLQSAAGPVTLNDFRGKVVVMFFGYTHCPDVCPRDMDIMAKALKGLDHGQQQRTQGIFISLDPARDDVKTLQDFTQYFYDGLLGVTASEERVREFSSGFGIQYSREPVANSSTNYSITHSTSFYVLDAQGRLSYILPNGISSQALQQAIQFLLSENS